MALNDIFKRVKKASCAVAAMTDETRNRLLGELATAICDNKKRLLDANKADLDRMQRDNPLYDRLLLTERRLDNIACDMRHVASLPSPVNRIAEDRTLANGLRLRKLRVPFGVVGVIYEARPNVSFDVFALCLKSGNACVLKGGKDADSSNKAIADLIHEVLGRNGEDPSAVELLPSTHEATAGMLAARGLIDVCIPRGGKQLITFVRDNASIPVIETGAGVVHAYCDSAADTAMAASIINNAKTRRVSVCNALDCLIIHRDRLDDLPKMLEPLAKSNVRIYADMPAAEAIRGRYPDSLTCVVRPDIYNKVYGTEFMDYAMAVKTVSSTDEAIAHIAAYGSGHSECIITNDKKTARTFQRSVDAACVYWNAPTCFTDGAQFGMGAEIGISTQKLGPRGPMALEEMTTYKWIIDGHGQLRE